MAKPTTAQTKIMGKRILAALIDIILWTIILIVASIFFGTKEVTRTATEVNVNFSLKGWPALIYFLSEFAYFIVGEWKTGKTVGKALLKIKTVSEDGGALTLGQSLKRNLLRVVDAFPFVIPYFTGLLFISMGETKQRLGDKVAKTYVVKDE